MTGEQAERQKLRCGVWGGLEPPRVGEKQGQRFRFLSNRRHRHGRPRTGKTAEPGAVRPRPQGDSQVQELLTPGSQCQHLPLSGTPRV